MKDFDANWQACAARARSTPPVDERAPPGFAARVVALAAVSETPSLVEVWQRLVLRVLAGTACLLVICLVLELPYFRERRPLEPGIENTVAQLVWSL
jgi:hypothetical protein